MKKTALVVAVLLLAGAVTAQDMIGPLPAFGRTFTGSTRGFYCPAPVDFFVHGLRVPDESVKGFQYVALMRNPTAPPAYSATVSLTPDFLETTGKAPSANILPCKVMFTKGEHLIVIGGCASAAGGVSNSYAGLVGGQPAMILGAATTLTRCGVQASIATATAGPYAMWSEATGGIARVEVYVTDVHLMGDKASLKPGETVSFGIEGVPAFANMSYYMASSIGKGPFLIEGRNVWLNADPMFQLSLQGTLPGIFANFSNLLDAKAMGNAKLNIPPVSALIGYGIYTCCSVWDKVGKPRGFSNPVFITVTS